MPYGLDVVAIGVEDKSPIIAGMIGTLAGRPIVFPACREACGVKARDGFAIRSLKGKMAPGHVIGRGVDKQLVRRKEGFPFKGNFAPHRCEHCPVKDATSLQIGNAKVQVIDQATPVMFHS